MTEDQQETMSRMKRHDYFRGLPEDLLEEVASHIQLHRFDTGEMVHPANEAMKCIGFLSSGRLKGVIIDAQGVESFFRFAEAGEQVGMITAAMSEPMPISLYAVEPSVLLTLDHQVALDLTAKHANLRTLWGQRLSGAIRRQILGDRGEENSSVITFLHLDEGGHQIASKLVSRLCDLGEQLGVVTTHPELFSDDRYPVKSMKSDGQWLSHSQVLRQLSQWEAADRTFIDVDPSLEPEDVVRAIALSRKVLVFARPENRDQTRELLELVESQSEAFRDKIAIVWLLDEHPVGPAAERLRGLITRDFNYYLGASDPVYGASVANVFQRMIQYLRGIQIGLALGGGAARGMAHLGVLRALERNNIAVDMIAGTSAGAMTGVLYSAGFSPEYLIERFTEDLKPSWLFRSLPHGGYWYLLYKYRSGKFDPMLRSYLNDWSLEQLPIRCSAVAVDLVGGQAVVRDSGDAVHAILDSINLPLLSSPIVRQGEALIDGGFINNVPADVLCEKGCNFVIAVDVLAKIEAQFGKIRPDTPAEQAKAPNVMQTILRTYAVQSHNMNAVGIQPADIRVEPNVCEFGMAEFTRAAEMAQVGEKALEHYLPRIQTLLTSLESRTAQR